MAEEDSVAGPSTSNEPPMKKARYVWQIKGHYRLKQEAEADRQQEKELEDLIDRWESSQYARAFYDNFINDLIEKTGITDFDFPDFDDVPGYYIKPEVMTDGTVMDEAVEMAIRSHGLQKPCTGPDLNMSPLRRIPFHQRDYYNIETPSTSSFCEDSSYSKSELERDILSEAVSIAIQKKGLGAVSSNESEGLHKMLHYQTKR